MRFSRCVVTAALVLGAMSAAFAQGDTNPTVTDLSHYIEALECPESLSLRITGVFQSSDFEELALRTLEPFEDPSVIGDWWLVKGERYDYEVSLTADGDWRLRSLALSVLGQAAARSATAPATTEMTLSGSFIARYGGFMLPHFAAEGEAERDCIVRLATLTLPDPSGFKAVETDDPGVKLARLDVREFVADCERLGGEAVLQVEAPDGSTVELWTIGYPDEAVTLPVNEQVGTRPLPSAPWALRISLPEGMTVDDLPEGKVSFSLNAAGTLPDWLKGQPQ